jgi:hypothetical protein
LNFKSNNTTEPNNANRSVESDSLREGFSLMQFILLVVFFFVYTFSYFYKTLKSINGTFAGIDLRLFFFPYKMYWVESIKQGDPAFWNPYLGLGNPFAANNTLGAFSPENIFLFFLPPELAFTSVCFTYFVLGAVGTFLFMKKLGCEWRGSLLASLGFAFSTFPYIQLAWGKICMVAVQAALPWTLYFLHRAFVEKRLWLLAMVSICLALAFLEGGCTQMVLYIFIMMAFYLIYAWLRRIISFKEMLLMGTLVVADFAILSACQLLPSFELIPKSIRGSWSFGSIDDYFKPVNLQHFISPVWGLWTEIAKKGLWFPIRFDATHVYIGFVTFVLFLAGSITLRKLGYYSFFLFSAVLFILLSLGDSTQLSGWIYRFFINYVPFYNKFRYSDRVIFLSCFAMACGAGWVLSATVNNLKIKGSNIRRWGMGMIYLALIFMAVDMWKWGYCMSGDLGSFNKKTPIGQGVFWDMIEADKSYPRFRPIEIWNNQNLFFKVSQHPITDPMNLKELDFTDPLDSPMADLINLKYVECVNWTPSKKWKLLDVTGHYLNLNAFPRTFLAGGYQLTDGDWNKTIKLIDSGTVDLRSLVLLDEKPKIHFLPEPGIAGEAEITTYRNNSVEMTCNASRPCFLFLSDAFYPYWKAWVDGKETPIYRANGSFRAVPIETPGNHRVEMKYRPFPLFAGLVISFLGWLNLIWIVWKKRQVRLFE